MRMDVQALRAEFRERFGGEPRLFRAPGRVNLIGEHTDYNDGFVLPAAIDRFTTVAAAPRTDRRLTVASLRETVPLHLDLDRPHPPRRGGWTDYIEGVAQVLRSAGHPLGGADLLIDTDVPVGAGLSSSAALEMAVGLALLALAGVEGTDRRVLARIGQRAEHEWVGMKCGIMDQLISALAVEGQALLIDCRSLETRPVPLALQEHCFVICDSRVKHQLAGSAYNDRRQDCETAVRRLARWRHGILALRDLTPADLGDVESRLPECLLRRVRHVVMENDRVLTAADSLTAGNVAVVGRCMTESHASLRDDYQVSCPEIDTLVDLALAVDGVCGARITGGGFGGCTVNLLRREAVEHFRTTISKAYRERTGLEVRFVEFRPAAGVKEITE